MLIGWLIFICLTQVEQRIILFLCLNLNRLRRRWGVFKNYWAQTLLVGFWNFDLIFVALIWRIQYWILLIGLIFINFLFGLFLAQLFFAWVKLFTYFIKIKFINLLFWRRLMSLLIIFFVKQRIWLFLLCGRLFGERVLRVWLKWI